MNFLLVNGLLLSNLFCCFITRFLIRVPLYHLLYCCFSVVAFKDMGTLGPSGSADGSYILKLENGVICCFLIPSVSSLI